MSLYFTGQAEIDLTHEEIAIAASKETELYDLLHAVLVENEAMGGHRLELDQGEVNPNLLGRFIEANIREAAFTREQMRNILRMAEKFEQNFEPPRVVVYLVREGDPLPTYQKGDPHWTERTPQDTFILGDTI